MVGPGAEHQCAEMFIIGEVIHVQITANSKPNFGYPEDKPVTVDNRQLYVTAVHIIIIAAMEAG